MITAGWRTGHHGNGRIAQLDTTAEYFLGDALGSVRQLTDASGAVTYAQSYDPYGQALGSVTPGTSYGFTGEWSDPAVLLYLRARHYSAYHAAHILYSQYNHYLDKRGILMKHIIRGTWSQFIR